MPPSSSAGADGSAGRCAAGFAAFCRFKDLSEICGYCCSLIRQVKQRRADRTGSEIPGYPDSAAVVKAYLPCAAVRAEQMKHFVVGQQSQCLLIQKCELRADHHRGTEHAPEGHHGFLLFRSEVCGTFLSESFPKFSPAAACRSPASSPGRRGSATVHICGTYLSAVSSHPRNRR